MSTLLTSSLSSNHQTFPVLSSFTTSTLNLGPSDRLRTWRDVDRNLSKSLVTKVDIVGIMTRISVMTTYTIRDK